MLSELQRKNRLTPEQVLEWADNPVTLAWLEIAKEFRDDAEAAKGVNVYHPFEPQKTQEVLASLNAVVDTWDIVVNALSKEEIQEEIDELSE